MGRTLTYEVRSVTHGVAIDYHFHLASTDYPLMGDVLLTAALSGLSSVKEGGADPTSLQLETTYVAQG